MLCGLTYIVVALFSGCVVHNTVDETKQRMEEQARLPSVEPSYVAHYEVSLIEVQRSRSAQARFGDMKIEADPGKRLFMAEHQLMRIIWAGPDDQLGFDLLNKSEASLKILWDAAAFAAPCYSRHGDIPVHLCLQGEQGRIGRCKKMSREGRPRVRPKRQSDPTPVRPVTGLSQDGDTQCSV